MRKRNHALAILLATGWLCAAAQLAALPSPDEVQLAEKYRTISFDTTGLSSSRTSGDYQLYELPGKVYVWQDKAGNQTANLPDTTVISISVQDGKEVERTINLPSRRYCTVEPGKDPVWGIVLDPAPDFDLPVIANGTGSKKLSALRGSWVLLDFWASWCGPCMNALPDTQALAKKYKGKGLVVIGVNIDGQRKSAEAAIAKLGLTFPVVYADADAAGKRDWQSPQISDYRITGIPCLVLIDPQGVVRNFGFIREDMIVKAMKL